MRIEHLTNTFTKFGAEISEQLSSCSAFSIATAFINSDAINEMEKALKKNRKLQTGKLLIGIYGYFNQRADLLRLKILAQQYAEKFQVQVSKDISFHWKYYYFNTMRKESYYIGSANFTTGGMGGNGELMLKIVNPDKNHAKSFDQLQDSFDLQWRKSGPIGKLRIDLYPEVKTKSSPVKLAKDFKVFFLDEETPTIKTEEDEIVVVSYFTKYLKASTSKQLCNYNPDWQNRKVDFLPVPIKDILTCV